MKYAILIGDGMADEPIASIGGKTPLEAAETPFMDQVASDGTIGLLRSVPEGYPPGSDVANLSILGYDPRRYYTGRAPLEAASIGVELAPTDVAYRCNLVTLSGAPERAVMADYSAGHISTEEAREIITTLDKELSSFGVRFYPGKSYRHLMVMADGPTSVKATPPHDISDKETGPHMPSGEGSERIVELMERSRDILRDHPINRARREEGKNTADSIWLWGQGRAPSMESYPAKYGVEGSIISAVDLMCGIGVYAGLKVIDVPGATGYLDTNYSGKAEYALKSLKERDFICVHVEAPDEAGHQGLLAEKIRAIEDFDKKVVGRMLSGLSEMGEFRVMVVSDHPTPVELKTHTSDPVPFAVLGSADAAKGGRDNGFTEANARASGVLEDDCEAMMKRFLSRPSS